MNALVISGGGSKGAFAGGLASYLVNNLNRQYDLFVGSSTGNLLLPLIASGEFELLKKAYTSVTQKDIFSINPFKIKKNENGSVKIDINYFNILYNLLIKKNKSLGDSSVLRNKTIPKFFTEENFNFLKQNNKEIISCVTNATLGTSEYKSSLLYSYEDFLDWMYASACAPPFMSVIKKDKYEYTDGGVMEHVPLKYAIDRGATEIDVIVLRKEHGEYPIELTRNPLHWVFKMTGLQMLEISLDDVKIGKLKAENKNIKLNIYYTPKKLTNNSLVFDKIAMSEWWDLGYSFLK